MSKSIVRSLSILVLSAGMFTTGCAGRHVVPLRESRAVLLASPQESETLRSAIARALAAQRFTAESEQEGRVVAQYAKGRIQLRLEIAYTPSEYRIKYLDSDGLGQQAGVDGAPVISDRYEKIVRDLGRSIDDELGRPEREAAQAADEQRRHELALANAERQKEADAQRAAADERERERQFALERERIRAEGRRPVVVQQRSPRVVYVEPAAPPPTRVVVVRERHAPPPPPPPTCREALLQAGHSSTGLMFCNGAEPRCAVALLRAGHNPAQLIHCQGVDPGCAEASLRRGDNPAQLLHCR